MIEKLEEKVFVVAYKRLWEQLNKHSKYILYLISNKVIQDIKNILTKEFSFLLDQNIR